MRFAALARRARQLPERVIPHWAKIVRLTTAAVIAYLFAKLVDPSVSDLTGPLTALLVVQSSLTQSLTSGIGRVASVLTGILVAVTLSIWVGLTWWSLGIAIGSALILAHLLRLGDHILETPISAMLILGVSNHDVAAQTRIVNTLIGAAVGMTFNLAFPPAVRVGTIQESIRAVTGSTAEVLHRAAAELREDVDRRQVRSWISEIHQVFPLLAQAETLVADTRAARRFNPRALTTVDSLPIVSAGLASLDGAVVAIRSTLMAFGQEVPDAPDPTAVAGTSTDDPARPASEYDAELQRAFASVLSEMGDCVAAYGELTIAEAQGRDREAEAALAQTLETLRETRAMLTELVMLDPAHETTSWILHGSILGGVESVLRELDVDTRVRMMTGAIPKIRPVLDASGQIMNRVWLNSQPWAPQRRPEDS